MFNLATLNQFKLWMKTLGRALVLALISFASLLSRAQQFSVNGNASSLSCDCYRLTTASNTQFGSVWNNNLLDLSNPFDFSFDVFLGCNDGGADGMAFVLQPVSTSLGASGGGMGYQGITPSLAVEIDTYQNSSDPSYDHIAIMQNGGVDHGTGSNLAGPVQASSTSGNVEDCGYHVLRLVWDPAANSFQVFFDGVLRTSYNGNIIASIFGGNSQVYWGFTAATGGQNNEHRFCLNIIPSFNTATPSVCEGNPTQFNDASTSNLGSITQWTWNFGDGTPTVSGIQNPSHTYATAGNYNVTLTVNDISGCGASQTFPVLVLPSPQVTAGQDQSVCEGTLINLSIAPADPTLTYNWSPPDGIANPNAATTTWTALNTTNFTLTVTDANGCSGSDNFTITVFPNPEAQFTVSNHCLGDIAPFTDQSTVQGGTIVAWGYNLGDGFSANVQNPGYVYSAPGTYNTTLTVQDNNGCVATSAPVPVTVYPLPTPSFTSTNACLGTPNNFTSTSTPAGSLVLYAWDFGDNTNPVPGNAVSYTYTFSGQYLVTHAVQDNHGCISGVQQLVNVFDVPTANFTIADVCLGTQVCPVNTSTVAATETISTYDWDWGDGTPNDVVQSPCHTYASAGTYTVTLTVTTANGCSDVFTTSVTINQPPTASFTWNNVCDGQVMTFTNTSTSTDGVISNSDWNYGDGSVSLAQTNGSHSFASDATYNVVLDITSSLGCTATVTNAVTVYPAPNLAFTTTSECEDVPLTITDASTINPPATILGWSWDYGDGSAAGTGANTTHLYAAGTYDITLTVTTSDGCTASITNQAVAHPLPVTDFEVLPVCEGSPSLFTNQSSVSTGTITTYAWDFGGGNVSAQSNPSFTFTFNSPNTNYPVTLVTTTNQGCSSTATLNAVVNPNPVADYTSSPNPVCKGLPVTFSDNSTIPAPGTIDSWNYNFNQFQGAPGLPSTHAYTPVASFTYNTALIYNVSLIVTSDQGCTNTIVHQVEVSPIPTPDFSSDFVCLGNSTHFVDLSTVINGSITNWSWNFGDNSAANLTQFPTHSYGNDGSFQVSLTVTSDNGCTASITKEAVVNPLPQPNFSAAYVCIGNSTSFNNTSTINSGNIATHVWIYGDGSPNDTTFAPTHTYLSPNDYVVTLKCISDSGCVATTTNNYFVYPSPVPFFNYTIRGDSCQPVAVDFSEFSTVPTIGSQTNTIDPASILFDFGDNSQGTISNSQHVYTLPGVYDVSLTISTNHGCTATFTEPALVVVNPLPVAQFFPNKLEVDMFAPTIEFTHYSEDAVEWLYDFGDGTFSDDSNSFRTFVDTGCFDVTLRVWNQFGCEDQITKEVCVFPLYALYIPSAFTVNEDKKNAIFNAQGEGVKEFEMKVFNRWGEEVFWTKSLDNGWDGIVQTTGADAQQGVYTYSVNATDFKDRKYNYKGRVTLIR
ncbi:MAG: PKD domain-containing protein [Bacteroidia bacterium]|nr:PKD domain-containing protein [Bacteroidia bacterium]